MDRFITLQMYFDDFIPAKLTVMEAFFVIYTFTCLSRTRVNKKTGWRKIVPPFSGIQY